MPLLRPPVELIFFLEGLGVLAVLAAITVLWGRSAKREQIWIGGGEIVTPIVYESFKEGDGIALRKPNLKPNEVPVVYLKVQRIKWLANGRGATIFAGNHGFRNTPETSGAGDDTAGL